MGLNLDLNLGLEIPKNGNPSTPSSSFTPASLFTSGEQGAWYDPSDETSMFTQRDPRFVTANPGAGDPVGILLDKSQMGGQTAGAFIDSQPNVNDNTWPNSSSEWVEGPTGTWSITNATGNEDLRDNNIVTSGNYYRFTFTITGDTLGVFTGFTAPSTLPAGTYTIAGRATTSFVIFRASAGETATVSNIVIQEIPGNHAQAPSDAGRPLRQTASGLWYIDADGVDDRLSTEPKLDVGVTWTISTGIQADAGLDRPFTTTSRSTGANSPLADSGRTSWLYANDTDTGNINLVTGDISVTHIFTIERASNSSMTGRYNGTEGSTIDGFDEDTANAGVALFSGRNITQNLPLLGRIYNFVVIDRAVTADELSDLETFNAGKAGVTL